MRAIIKDNNWIWFENIPDYEEEAIWQAFSVSTPNIYIDPTQLGQWDGIHRKYNRAKKRMARPLLAMLKSVCKEKNLPLVVIDEREEWPYNVTDPDDVNSDFLPGITLDEHQINAIRKGCKIECGIFDLPTGSGKGEIVAGLCKAIECPTVIIADQQIVVQQLKQRIELRDVTEEVGVFYAGKKPNGQTIVTGTIQSLSPPKKTPEKPKRTAADTDKTYQKKLDNWGLRLQAFQTRKKNAAKLLQYVKKAQMIIWDEVDKAASKQAKDIFRYHYRGRRRYGLSGTVYEKSKPVENMVITEHFGSVIARETRARMQDIGRIIPIDYYMLAFGLEGNKHGREAYDIAYDDWIVNNAKFHRTVAGICKRYPGDGTLILVDREPLGLSLMALLNSMGMRSAFIYGKTPKKKRAEVLAAFERRELDVLIGGKIINRGLDLSGGCENLILASSGKMHSDFLQKIGRAVRHNKRGRSRVFDFLFLCNQYLYDHSRVRLKCILESDAGYKTVVLFPNGKVDGADFVKSRLRVKPQWVSRDPKLF